MSDQITYVTGIRGVINLANDLTKKRDKDEALRNAAKDTRIKEMERLLDSGANVNAVKGKYRTTVLMEAAVEGNEEVVKFLLNRGADVNAKDKDGWTSLMGATVEGHLETAQLLLTAGADVNAQNDSGDTALNMAFGMGQFEIADVLLENGGLPTDARHKKRGECIACSG